MAPSSSMPSTGNPSKPASAKAPANPEGSTRETIESIVMAIVLALLFRGFVAEAFVIPTGSMAPTLCGAHKDVWCPQCNYRYQSGTSQEQPTHVVRGTVCPMCFYGNRLDIAKHPNDASMSGDRIIVSKFAYDWYEPQRWDVFVFKYPGDAAQNYIKRLIGLPGETIRIQAGNIWVKKKGEDAFNIARKPPHRLDSLLQLVHDTDYNAKSLVAAGALSRWYEEGLSETTQPSWEVNKGLTAFTLADKPGIHWLRYRHIPPRADEWEGAENNDAAKMQQLNAEEGELITDFYTYNTEVMTGPTAPLDKDFAEGHSHGEYWVDDLAVEVTAQIKSKGGKLLLDLVRGGMHHTCTIDVETGKATLVRTGVDGKRLRFQSGKADPEVVTAETKVRGPGTYRIRLSNVDHEMLLWVDGSVVKTNERTRYESPPVVAPTTSDADPGDLQPARIGGENIEVVLKKLQIYRDKYYIAQKKTQRPGTYVLSNLAESNWDMDIRNPTPAGLESYFKGRIAVDFELGEDQFFPLGDNSPRSQDARSWQESDRNRTDPPTFVKRDLLIGKAMVVYWPHTWNRPLPFWPNFSKMRRIR